MEEYAKLGFEYIGVRGKGKKRKSYDSFNNDVFKIWTGRTY